MRRRQWLAAAICVLLALGGCNNGKKDSGGGRGSGGGGGAGDSPSVGLPTPKALVEAEILCTDKLDIRTERQFIVPEYRQWAKIMGDVGDTLTTQVPAKYRVLADAVEKQPWGRQDAVALRRGADGLTAQLKALANKEIGQVYQDGRIDWAKIDLKQDGDEATATWPGKSKPLEMTRIEGKWYVLPTAQEASATPEQAVEKAQAAWRTVSAAMAKLDDMVVKLGQGRLDSQQFKAGLAEFARLMVQVRSQVRQ